MVNIVSSVFSVMVVKTGSIPSQKLIDIIMICVRLLMLFHIQEILMIAIIEMNRKQKWQML
jgi:hypothetical protein